MKHQATSSTSSAVKAALLLTCFLGISQHTLAQAQPNLNPSWARNTDSRINNDLRGYQTQQNAIKALNDSGKFAVDSYAMAKAQCWLDVSFHEYTRNDRSAYAQLAMDESVKLTNAMQYTLPNAADGGMGALRGVGIGTQTAERVRNDLWAQAERLKATPGFGGLGNCGERQVACAEVELDHAANEYRQQGWRHSRPYIQIAENNLKQAAVAVQQCYTPPAPIARNEVVVERVVERVVDKPVERIVERVVERVVDKPVERIVERFVDVPRPVVAMPVELSTTALFNFNKRDIANVRPFSKEQLDAFIAKIKQGNVNNVAFSAQSIQVIGHADRTNETGNPDYNRILASDRAEAVRAYMVSQGVSQSIVTSVSRGDSQQVQQCNEKFATKADLQECLLPNRRVEVILKAFR